MDDTILRNLRQEYHSRPFTETGVLKDPVEQFRRWFDEAVAAGLPEPNAMTLATSNIDFKPSARIVLLHGIANDDFIFYTNYESRKGHELLWNPYAALLFFWNQLHRQVRVEGRVKKLAAKESDDYFHSRPRESQLGAHVSHQSEVIADRELLEDRYALMEKKFAGTEIPRPEYWGGYAVTPQRIEFWQGRPGRLHDRLVFTRVNENDWMIERLSP